MQVSQQVLNGALFLQNGRPMVLTICPGNPHYGQLESLERLFDFAARSNSDKVFLFIPGKISEHSYRAIGSKNPERTARQNANNLQNKCKKVFENSALRNAVHSYIRWEEEVESCPQYRKALADIKALYQGNKQFRNDTRETTEEVLMPLSLNQGRGKASSSTEDTVDIEEGVLFLLKELAFLVAVPGIYKNCEEFVFVYHRPWPVFERFCAGYYDGIEKLFIGFFVLE